MNSKRFEQRIAANTSFAPAAVDKRTRDLRAAGLLPLGPRGRHAPDIEPWAAANILISLAAPAAPGCAEFVSTCRRMVERDGEFIGADFGETLSRIMGNFDLAEAVQEIRIVQSWPGAFIIRRNGETVRFGPADQEETGFASGAYVETVFRGSVLGWLAGLISGTVPETHGGWASAKQTQPEASA